MARLLLIMPLWLAMLSISISLTHSEMEHPKTFRQIAHEVGTDKVTTHKYHVLYEHHLAPFRMRPVRLLEIGLGCDMRYGPGKSWALWDQYFIHKDAHISFMEVDAACSAKWAGNITRGNIYVGSQADPAVLENVIQKNAKGFDIIIDDGGHTMKQQQESFNALWKLVKPGGLYVIEDLQTSYMKEYFSDGYNTTINVMKELLDALDCQKSRVPCLDILHMDCAKEICIIQKTFQKMHK